MTQKLHYIKGASEVLGRVHPCSGYVGVRFWSVMAYSAAIRLK